MKNHNQALGEISQKIKQLMANSPAADMEKNLRALLSSTFAKLDLVTREEFDVQREVLLRAREKISVLETKLAELERVRRAG
jgi:BMFP domain-containing protein YqiC